MKPETWARVCRDGGSVQGQYQGREDAGLNVKKFSTGTPAPLLHRLGRIGEECVAAYFGVECPEPELFGTTTKSDPGYDLVIHGLKIEVKVSHHQLIIGGRDYDIDHEMRACDAVMLVIDVPTKGKPFDGLPGTYGTHYALSGWATPDEVRAGYVEDWYGRGERWIVPGSQLRSPATLLDYFGVSVD